MGRPALLGSRSRGPQYRGVRRPPHYGNRPWKRNSNQNARHKAKTPKGGARLLASPLLPQQPSRQDTNKMALTSRQETPKTRTAHVCTNDSDNNTAGGPLPGGCRVEAAGPKHPPFSCLGNRCDFWGPRWASQSQIAKIAAISVRQAP